MNKCFVVTRIDYDEEYGMIENFEGHALVPNRELVDDWVAARRHREGPDGLYQGVNGEYYPKYEVTEVSPLGEP